MRQVCYDHAFMFAYSMRAKTHASHRMQDNVPDEIKLRRLAEVIDTYNVTITEKNLVEDQGRLHVVLVQGRSKRSNANLTGLTDTNKRCVFQGRVEQIICSKLNCCNLFVVDVPVPAEASVSRDLMTGDFHPVQQDVRTPRVTLSKGDYVLVRVHEAGRHTLHATPIARTTLQEVNQLIPKSLLGPRTHDFSKLFASS